MAPIALAIFGAMLGSSEAVAVTYLCSQLSKTIATARLSDRDNLQVTTVDDGFYYSIQERLK
jgi:hypothetical protein